MSFERNHRPPNLGLASSHWHSPDFSIAGPFGMRSIVDEQPRMYNSGNVRGLSIGSSTGISSQDQSSPSTDKEHSFDEVMNMSRGSPPPSNWMLPMGEPYFPSDPEQDVYETLARTRDADSDYSRKVFLGGLPMGLTADKICQFFECFGPLTIDWPHRDRSPLAPPNGYAFAVYQNSESVNALISNCTYNQGKLCIRMDCASSFGERNKVVQVRPWRNQDRVYYTEGYRFDTLDTRYSIFMGGVPRTTTAEELANLLQNSIGDVAMVAIEVDFDTEYPKGAAKVVFCEREAYVSAIACRHLFAYASDQQKEMEMKPFLEEYMECEECRDVQTRHFCAELRCLKYLCDPCWTKIHSKPHNSQHQPMVKGFFSAAAHRSPRPTTTVSTVTTNISSINQDRGGTGTTYAFGQPHAHHSLHDAMERDKLSPIGNIGFWNDADARNSDKGLVYDTHIAAALKHNSRSRDGNSFILGGTAPAAQFTDRGFGFDDHRQRDAVRNRSDQRLTAVSNIFNDVRDTRTFSPTIRRPQRNIFDFGFVSHSGGGNSEFEHARGAGVDFPFPTNTFYSENIMKNLINNGGVGEGSGGRADGIGGYNGGYDPFPTPYKANYGVPRH